MSFDSKESSVTYNNKTDLSLSFFPFTPLPLSLLSKRDRMDLKGDTKPVQYINRKIRN